MTTCKTCCSSTPVPHFSKAGTPKGDSFIQQILALAARPDVISFGGGLPSPEGFPLAEVKAAADYVIDTDGKRALQYSSLKGDPALRAIIAERETARGCPTTADDVQIVSGSQQALDLMARLFIDPGSKILVESPTYLGALQAFMLCNPECVEIPTDAFGMNPDLMGEECRGARFAYVMPTFQNPTGLTISVERRKKLAEKAREYDFWLVEDNPYGELYYGDEPPASMRAFCPERTITLGTMSKVLAPGFRLGYIIAPKAVLDAAAEMNLAMALHTATYTQLVTARVLSQGLFEEHLPKVRDIYRSQAKVMLDALDEYMPKHPEITWTRPEGGMFIWLTFPKGVDASEVMKKTLASDVPVGFVPGEAFYANNPKDHVNTCRFSFVTVPPEKIVAGVKSVAEALKTFL